jgi:hypothetical protein
VQPSVVIFQIHGMVKQSEGSPGGENKSDIVSANELTSHRVDLTTPEYG